MLGFMKQSRTTKVDKQHNYEEEPYFVAESWLVKSVDPFFEEEGAWAAGIKIEDADTWEEVKKGEITGFSIAGLAQVEQIEKSPKEDTPSQFNKEDQGIWEKVKKFFAHNNGKDFQEVILEKDFNSRLKRNELWVVLDSFTSAIHEDLRNEEVKDKKAAFLKNIDQLRNWVNRNIKKSDKENTEMTVEDIKKAVGGSIGEALKPVVNRLEALEKQQKEQTEALESRLEKIEKKSNGKKSKDGQDPQVKDVEKEEEARIFMPSL